MHTRKSDKRTQNCPWKNVPTGIFAEKLRTSPIPGPSPYWYLQDLYAISILWTEWAAERKRKRAVGEQSQIQNDGGGAAAPSHDDNARPAVDGTMEAESSVAADEALLSLLCLDGQHNVIEKLRAGGHVGQLASVTELELEQAGLPLLQRRALMEALHEEGEPTTLNPLLAMARP